MAMDIEGFEKYATEVRKDLLKGSREYLINDLILHAKTKQLFTFAIKFLPHYKTFFETLWYNPDSDTRLEYYQKGKIAEICDFILHAIESEKENKIEEEEKFVIKGFGKEHLRDLDLSMVSALSICFIDIDDFRKINNLYGRTIGDKVIEGIGNCLRRLENSECHITRNYMRGDEFLIIMKNKAKKEAYEIIEKIRKDIEASEFYSGLHVTISAGIATYPDDAKSKNDLIEKADIAERNSKENGKNMVTLYGDEQNFKTISFRFEGIANITNGSKVSVKSWRNHNPPSLESLEVVEFTDLNTGIPYTSSNKGTMMTVIVIEKEIIGSVTEVKRPSSRTEFKLRVHQNQLEGISTNPKDFHHPFF